MHDGDSAGADHSYDPGATHGFPDERLNEVLAFLDEDETIRAYLEAQNVNPVDRMRYNDHGPKHVSIVQDRALRLYDLLKASDVEFNGARQQGLDEADESVIVALAAALHDVGNLVHRERHAFYSVPIASDVLDRILDRWYDAAAAVRMKGEVLHAILCHHSPVEALTTEAGVIRVADALDMERGRSRRPYEEGGRGINTISSQAIERVSLKAGDSRPVLVEIEMTDAAGVYQIDSLLKAKLSNSGLEDEVRIVAVHVEGSQEQLVERIEL